MHTIFMTNDIGRDRSGISMPVRFLVTTFGVVSWVAGGIGAFREKSTVGFTSLIVAGSFALLIAGKGHWPNKFSFGGGDAEWAKAVASVNKAFETQITNRSATLEDVESLKKAHSDAVLSIYKSMT